MLPNFIIVGAPKSGTTSLYHYLTEHPQVYMSNPKEVNYFSKYEIEAQGLYYNDFKAKDLPGYKKLFAGVTDQKAIGEGSVSYLFYPGVPAKIKSVIPYVKIIILLRNPVDRAFSHYLMDYRLGLVNLSFSDIVYRNGSHKKIHLYYQQYIELGFYYEQVKRYLDLFSKEQVKIYLQEDLREDTERVISDLYNFLGIDNYFMPDIKRAYNAFSIPKNRLISVLYKSYFVRKSVGAAFPDAVKRIVKNILFERGKKPTINDDDKKYLCRLYWEDIKKLESIIYRNLSHWYGNVKNVYAGKIVK